MTWPEAVLACTAVVTIGVVAVLQPPAGIVLGFFVMISVAKPPE